jgi:hypothetical protein
MAQLLWVIGDFAESFGLEPDVENSGAGHGPSEEAAARPRDAQALTRYDMAVQCPAGTVPSS